MKKIYTSPAIEVTAFIAEDILCASTIVFGGDNYDVVSNSVTVNDGGVQRIADASLNTAGTYFGQ